MDVPKELQFNLRGEDGQAFVAVRESYEREHGRQSNTEIVRRLLKDHIKRKKLGFKYKEG